MKALVTGADGFGGSWLVENLLAKGYKVRAFVRNTPLLNLTEDVGLEVLVGDLMNYPSIQKATQHCDFVYHLGAMSGIEEVRRYQETAWDVNTKGTLNVINACIENRVQRMLYCSTCHIYGNRSILPITETSEPGPLDVYSAAKYAGEILCKSMMAMNPDLDIVISRAFNHFGPRQRGSFLIPKIITQAIRGKVELGARTPTRDFTYVRDIVDGYRLMMERGRKGEVYQLCSGEERSVEEIVTSILEEIGWKGEVKWSAPRPADIMRSYGKALKAQFELGWYNKTSWGEAVKETVKWYKEQ